MSNDGFYYEMLLSLIAYKIAVNLDIQKQRHYHQLYLKKIKKEKSIGSRPQLKVTY